MAKEITMPKLSDTMEEGKVLRWLKREGQRIERGEVIAEIETDKADMEMEAFDAGVLLAITVGEGETAPVGEVIGYVGEAGERVPEKAVPRHDAKAESEPAAGGTEPSPAPARTRRERSAREPEAPAGRDETRLDEKREPERGRRESEAEEREAEPRRPRRRREAAAPRGDGDGRRVAREAPPLEPKARRLPTSAREATPRAADVPGPHADIADVIDLEVEEEAEGEEGSARQVPEGAEPPGPRPRPSKGLHDRLPFRSQREARGEHVRISPLARRMAREAGLDPAALEGSGPDGRIVRADVERAIGERRGAQRPLPREAGRPGGPPGGRPERVPEARPAEAAPPVPVAAGELGTEIPHSKMRRAVATRMAEAKRTAPHFYTTVAVRMDRALELKDALAARHPGERVGVTHLLLKAAALALERYPRVNAVFEEDRIRIPREINIGLAVAVEDGLLVPVVRDSAGKPLLALAREARAVVTRAQQGKLAQGDLQGATFSISNMGMFPIEAFAAILTPPQSAILAVGAVADEPVVQGGAVVPGKVLRLTLSADHRTIDGVLAAAFLAEMKRFLETPLALVV